MPISSPGLGSNLDVNSIVNQLMTLESRPLVILASKEAQFQSKLSALGQVQGVLSGFQSAAKGLTSATSEDAYKATSSDSSIVSATASSGATAASHNISVSNIASAQQLVATGQASLTNAIGTGAATTVTLQFGTISGGTYDSMTGLYTGATFTDNANKPAVTIDLDDTNNTLEGIRDAINTAQVGVTASIVNDGSGTPYRLTLASDATGAANSLKIDVAGDAAIASLLAYDPAGTQNLTQGAAASDAALTLNGIAITSGTNVIDDVIDGFKLTLLKTGDATVTIARDTSKIRTALEALAKSYTDINKVIAEQTGFKATLQGDAAALSVQRLLRSALGAAQTGTTGGFSTLSQLGLSFERDGKMSFDDSKLQSALAAAPVQIQALVGAFGSSLTTLAENLVSKTGPINSRTEGLGRSIKDVNDRRDTISRRLQLTEARLRSEFTALDTLMSGMLATSNFLQQQLAGLANLQQR